jgi:hypothetical protein
MLDRSARSAASLCRSHLAVPFNGSPPDNPPGRRLVEKISAMTMLRERVKVAPATTAGIYTFAVTRTDSVNTQTTRRRPSRSQRNRTPPRCWGRPWQCNCSSGAASSCHRLPVQRSGIVLVYMAAHRFIPARDRPGTAAHTPPAINNQTARSKHCRDYSPRSYHPATHIRTSPLSPYVK